MLVTDLESLLEYQKNAPICDGNHEFVIDEDYPDDPPYCWKCHLVKE